MIPLRAYVEGIGVIGPGLGNWPEAAEVLTQRAALHAARTVLPAPAGLPSAERRRTGPVVRAALAAAHEAVAQSGRDAATLAAVFAASGGDGGNFHAICETLASDEPQLSPTRFHNSVHNAPAGYWSIATRAMAASNVLCAYDGSFAAGLLESLAQVSVDGAATLLVAYDTDYPEPLRSARPIDDAFGVALVLAPRKSERSLARIEARLCAAPVAALDDAALEALRVSNPAARALPLLEAIAASRTASVVLDYLDDTQLAVDVESPC
ncbi:beta-ketoacyl synthase chain length factor [Caballeronia sp. LZ034LL]|uniref:beta-ketoacyl synthase chain length factor n=1 Tax=Caballeronia sp. LZ034LL TaxID=3038567 RepID=UPI002867650D|nr:beta-ketoacyl synthase chain length factor [Caballeronia sp. LZ034LL]MDR5837190.1 beta-ketoacyl synthase chain length factor [Caballeronia sp. LZ034LL]